MLLTTRALRCVATHNQQGLQIDRELEALGAAETSGDPRAVAEAKQAVSNESRKAQANATAAQTRLAAGADVNKQTTFSLESPMFFCGDVGLQRDGRATLGA